MNALILNRQSRLPEDGWYQFEVPGEHINHDAKVVQVIDKKAIDSIMNRFAAEAKQPNFAGILVDRDHFSLQSEQTSEAMGWAMGLRDQDGIPQAKVDWSGVGRPLVESKPDQAPTFKYFSSVYDASECESLGKRKIGKETYSVIRPLRLDRLALTNDPNNKGGKPISNRQPAATAERSETQPTSTMKSVLKQLGLAEDASEESAVAALTKIQNRASLADALTTERDTLLTAQVATDLERFKGVIKNPEAVKKQLIANRASTIELLESLQVEPAAVVIPEKITNRAASKTPVELAAAKDAEKAEAAKAQKIQNRAAQIVKEKTTGRRPYSFTAAFNEARTEIEGTKS